LTYTPDNQPETITDALGHTIRQRFDEAGHLIEYSALSIRPLTSFITKPVA
jgi:YD repeat-containing protein